MQEIQYRDICAEDLFVEHPSPIPLIKLNHCATQRSENIGIWIHEDDLDFASSPLGDLSPKSVLIGSDQVDWEQLNPSKLKTRYLKLIRTDTANRASTHYQCPIRSHDLESSFEALFREWIQENDIQSIVYLQPFIGPANSTVQHLKNSFQEVDWHPLRRLEDSQYLPMAKSGFFGYWKKVEKTLV